MATPTLVSVDPMQIVVNWVELLTETATGRDPIIYYKLEWNQGTGIWTELTNPILPKATTFTLVANAPIVPNS